MKTELSYLNALHIPLVLVRYLLQKRDFGHTETQKHPGANLKH